MSAERGKDFADGSSSAGSPGDDHQQPATPSRYESQKRRDWNTFVWEDQSSSPGLHVLWAAEPPAPCTCPLRQAWGSLDALIGRLRAAYEENGGSPETNPFASGAIRVYLREVRECQAKARGIPYKKKKKKPSPSKGGNDDESSSTMHFS
ncbi:unnamed protein product [Prunus armeniaca]|uniref:ALOG domain-containing protein n=1 Tax=Prunus armeniaca TaxID=36596 RepID=A0A6J5WX46_PRUAR|nr:unnamed protein product [Prunus armeniaca]